MWTNNLFFWNSYFRRKLLWQDSCNCKSSPGGRRNTEMGHWNIVRESAASLEGAKKEPHVPWKGSYLSSRSCITEQNEVFSQLPRPLLLTMETLKYSCQLFRVPVKSTFWYLRKVLVLLGLQFFGEQVPQVCSLSCPPDFGPIPGSHYRTLVTLSAFISC